MDLDPPESWPEVDDSAVVEATREVPVQVNGKLRDKVVVPPTPARPTSRAAVLARPKIAALLDGRTPDRIVVAGGGKLVNIVLRDG